MGGGARELENSNGSRPFVIGCDRASNRIPDDCQRFLAGDALQMYIAWNPGALAVARILSAKFDARRIWRSAFRLVIDYIRAPSRAPSIAGLIITENEVCEPGPEHRDRMNAPANGTTETGGAPCTRR
jgi:predicted N-formylglutamate amidohydrolase